jgi:23S rRNA (uracil1939-C5)-methyltransferase
MLAPIKYSAPIETLLADNRFEYRNRIQLHYHKRAEVLGFKDAKNKIIDVRDCLISEPAIQAQTKELYSNNKWLDLSPSETSGHVEIYDSPEGLKTTWNKRYASGGFTQVNKDMNEKMVSLLNSKLKESNIEGLLDLFGGAGNLSGNYPSNRSVVDIYQKQMPKEFTSLDLHADDSLSKFTELTDKTFDTFVVDPPRSGFPGLSKWTSHYKPKNIHYISCHPQTMIRDLRVLMEENNYKIDHIHLIDLFPNTFHFEAYIGLSKS